jgi:hypothetical protein
LITIRIGVINKIAETDIRFEYITLPSVSGSGGLSAIEKLGLKDNFDMMANRYKMPNRYTINFRFS